MRSLVVKPATASSEVNVESRHEAHEELLSSQVLVALAPFLPRPRASTTAMKGIVE